jgi:hypothetical protein
MRSQPQLRRSILGTNINKTSVEGDCEGMLRVLKANVGVHHLSLFGCEESVGADEVHFRVGAENVGDDSGAVFVGVDLGEEPFCIHRGVSRVDRGFVEVGYAHLFLKAGLVIGFLLQLPPWWRRLHSDDCSPSVSDT